MGGSHDGADLAGEVGIGHQIDIVEVVFILVKDELMDVLNELLGQFLLNGGPALALLAHVGGVVDGDEEVKVVILVHYLVGAHLSDLGEHEQIQHVLHLLLVYKRTSVAVVELFSDVVEFLEIPHDPASPEGQPGELQSVWVAEGLVGILRGALQDVDELVMEDVMVDFCSRNRNGLVPVDGFVRLFETLP